jgi:hypothetical protein
MIRKIRRVFPFAVGVVIWLGLFLMCLVVIGPGLTGGILMAQDSTVSPLNIVRSNVHGKIAMIQFRIPPGSTIGQTYTETDPNAPSDAPTDQRLVIPYTELNGTTHRLVISNPADLMKASGL